MLKNFEEMEFNENNKIILLRSKLKSDVLKNLVTWIKCNYEDFTMEEDFSFSKHCFYIDVLREVLNLLQNEHKKIDKELIDKDLLELAEKLEENINLDIEDYKKEKIQKKENISKLNELFKRS